jgi:hypothetical protein
LISMINLQIESQVTDQDQHQDDCIHKLPYFFEKVGTKMSVLVRQGEGA